MYKYQRKLPKNLCYKKVIIIFALEKEVSETDYVRNFVVWPLRVYQKRFHLFGNAFFVYTGLKPTPIHIFPPDITINCHSSSSRYFYCTTAGFHPHNNWWASAQHLICERTTAVVRLEILTFPKTDIISSDNFYYYFRQLMLLLSTAHHSTYNDLS